MPAPTVSRALVAEGAPRGGLAALCTTQTTGWGVLYYGPARVRPLTILTLVAGFASTIFAPLTAALCAAFGTHGDVPSLYFFSGLQTGEGM